MSSTHTTTDTRGGRQDFTVTADAGFSHVFTWSGIDPDSAGTWTAEFKRYGATGFDEGFSFAATASGQDVTVSTTAGTLAAQFRHGESRIPGYWSLVWTEDDDARFYGDFVIYRDANR